MPMILADVNVLVYAFHADEPLHDPARAWLQQLVSAPGDRLALSESTVAGFLRIATNPRIYADPAPTALAASFVDSVVGTGRTTWLPANHSTWETFRLIVDDDRRISANLVPDAWLAALAISHGARLATADRGFGRFADLDYFDPTR